MSVLAAVNGDGLSRAADFFDPSQGFTKLLRIRFTSLPPAGTPTVYSTIWQLGGASFGSDPSGETPPVCGLFADSTATPLLYAYAVPSGSPPTVTDFGVAIIPNKTYVVALRYDPAGQRISTVINGDETPGAFTSDFSAITSIDAEWLLTDTSADSLPNIEIDLERMWSVHLSISEIVSEGNSLTPIRTDGLISSSTLSTPTDITETVAARSWTVLGDPETSASLQPRDAALVAQIYEVNQFTVRDAQALPVMSRKIPITGPSTDPLGDRVIAGCSANDGTVWLLTHTRNMPQVTRLVHMQTDGTILSTVDVDTNVPERRANNMIYRPAQGDFIVESAGFAVISLSTAGATTRTYSLSAHDFAVSRDGTVLMYCDGHALKLWDLVDDVAIGTWHTFSDDVAYPCWLQDCTVIVRIGFVTAVRRVKQDGTTLTDYPLPAGALDDEAFDEWAIGIAADFRSGLAWIQGDRDADDDIPADESQFIRVYDLFSGVVLKDRVETYEDLTDNVGMLFPLRATGCAFPRTTADLVLPNAELVNSTPCCDHQTGSSATPQAGPVKAGHGWTPQCTGGGRLYDDVDDLTDDEVFDLTRKDIDVWIEAVIAKYPASEGTQTLRYAKQPLADPGAFKEGRLIGLSPIGRKCSDINANYQIGKTVATIEDGDGTLRALFDQDTPTEYFINREAAAYAASPEGRAAGLRPRILSRGWISDIQTTRGRKAAIEIADIVGSQFCGFNLEKTVGSIKVRDVSTTAPTDLLDKMIPIAAGEFSDKGAVDDQDLPAEKGLWPVLDLGDININPGSPAEGATFADPPVITTSGVVGATGQQTLYYAASLITPLGESLLSNVVSCNGASNRDASNYNWLTGTFDDGGGANKVRIWVSDNGTDFHLWLDEADYYDTPTKFVYGDGNKVISVIAGVPTGTRQENDRPKELTSPGVNTAQTNPNIFGLMCVCLGYGYEFIDIKGSDLADQAEPRRVSLFDLGLRGSEIITPADAAWPYPNPWVELNDVRLFCFLARGNRLNHHRQGSVTFAVDFCGPHDADGLLVNQACEQLLWFLNEHAAKHNGTGYRGGDYGPLETYANGDPLFKVSAFRAMQAQTIDEMGTTLGAIGCLYVLEPTSLREIVRRWLLTYGARAAHNHFGQVFPFLVRPPAGGSPADDGPLLQDRIQITSIDDPILGHDEVLNDYPYTYHFDPDANDFRVKDVPSDDAISIAAHVPGGVVGDADRRAAKSVQDGNLYYTNDAATAAWSVRQQLACRSRRTRYVPIHVDQMGLELEIATPMRLTHYDGLGAGDDQTPGLILEHEVDANGFDIRLVMQDLRTLTPRASGSPS